MTRIRFIGDGPRDAVTVPPIVRTILSVPFESEAIPWPRLNERARDEMASTRRGNRPPKGYPGKVFYAATSARARGFHGVVATVDSDKSPKGERLGELKDGREQYLRSNPPFPIAVGCAIPHAEAWLLDDRVAVQRALGLATQDDIPSGSASPKAELDQLIERHRRDRTHMDVLAVIAAEVDFNRCPNSAATGLRAFVKDLKDEFRAFCKPSPNSPG